MTFTFVYITSNERAVITGIKNVSNPFLVKAFYYLTHADNLP